MSPNAPDHACPRARTLFPHRFGECFCNILQQRLTPRSQSSFPVFQPQLGRALGLSASRLFFLLQSLPSSQRGAALHRKHSCTPGDKSRPCSRSATAPLPPAQRRSQQPARPLGREKRSETNPSAIKALPSLIVLPSCARGSPPTRRDETG